MDRKVKHNLTCKA